MPAALQTVTFFKQNITGGAFEALAPAAGDVATFFNIPQDTGAYLSEIWAVDNASPCELSLTASRFHDQTFGIRLAVPSGALLAPTTRPSLLSPAGFDQPIYPSDVLSIQANGTAADNVNCTFQLYYPNLPGISPRLTTPGYVRQHMRNLVGVRVSPTSGAGTYGATVALNSVTNLLHADRDYALLGVTAQTPIASLVVVGIDTGNMRVGGPVLAAPEHDAYLFADLSDKYNVPLIPVIAANNAGATTIAAAHTAAAAKVVDLLFAELDVKFSSAF
jgi:hypothetical protein